MRGMISIQRSGLHPLVTPDPKKCNNASKVQLPLQQQQQQQQQEKEQVPDVVCACPSLIRPEYKMYS